MLRRPNVNARSEAVPSSPARSNRLNCPFHSSDISGQGFSSAYRKENKLQAKHEDQTAGGDRSEAKSTDEILGFQQI